MCVQIRYSIYPLLAIPYALTAASTDSLSISASPDYVRKHSPLILTDSVAGVPERALRHRNFNDFAVDLNASALPQWMFVTPNLVDDAHDSTIDFTSSWLEYWLVPLLQNQNFNDNRTLILLTFDEAETYTQPNQVFTLLLGGALPQQLVGQKDCVSSTICRSASAPR